MPHWNSELARQMRAYIYAWIPPIIFLIGVLLAVPNAFKVIPWLLLVSRIFRWVALGLAIVLWPMAYRLAFKEPSK